MVERGYEDVTFAFEQLASPSFEMSVEWSLQQLLGYLSTWSAARRYQRQHDNDPVAMVAEDIRVACGDMQQGVRLTWPLTVKSNGD